MPTGEIIDGGRMADPPPRPHPADHRLGGHLRLGLRVNRQAASAARPQHQHCSPVRDFDKSWRRCRRQRHGFTILEYIDNTSMAALSSPLKNLELPVFRTRSATAASRISFAAAASRRPTIQPFRRWVKCSWGGWLPTCSKGLGAQADRGPREGIRGGKALGADVIISASARVDAKIARGLAATRDCRGRLQAPALRGVHARSPSRAGSGEKKRKLMTDIARNVELGGAISEVRRRRPKAISSSWKTRISLMPYQKRKFRPAGILNPGVVFGDT